MEKHKQIRNSRQNDKLEQWIMHRTVEDDVLGSILGCPVKKKFFPSLTVSIKQLEHSYLFHC